MPRPYPESRMVTVRNLVAPRGLSPVTAGCVIALVVVAVFAWAEKSAVVDADAIGGSPVPELLWQLGAIIIAGVGLWMLRGCAGSAPRTCALVLGIYALAIFVNTYTPGFGDYDGAVWRTINALLIAFAILTAPGLWRCGCASGYVGAALMAALGIVVFVNAYFTNVGVVWQIMNPLMMLAALAWAAGVAHYAASDAGE